MAVERRAGIEGEGGEGSAAGGAQTTASRGSKRAAARLGRGGEQEAGGGKGKAARTRT